ncbi:MAG TPA: sulfotransferase [Rhizomicrobium sp.]
MNERIAPARLSTAATPPAADAFALATARLDAARPLRKPRLRQIAFEIRSDRGEQAERELSEYLARHSGDVDAIRLRAQALAQLGRRVEAETVLARCLKLAPDFSAARFERARLLLRLHKYAAALAEIDRLLISDPRNPLFRQLKGNILGFLGEYGQSLTLWEELAAENPGNAELRVSRGDALRALGRRDGSIAAYREAIECRPSFGAAWWSLANLKTFLFSDAEIGAMQEQLMRPGLAADDRVNLQFALGKAYEDLRNFERSFEQYARANAAMRLRIGYDRDSMASSVAAQKALFTPEFLSSRRDAGCSAANPIFVLGRPRAGSSLIVQILSAHPAIEGTGELPYIPELARQSVERRACGADYPQVLEKLEPAALEALGEEYMERARLHRKLGRPFFIDKNPSNYFHAGLIGLMLPNAKIIDARRHPAACCLSIFKQNFSRTNLRLSELGLVYRDYVELMAHFDRVMPGRIHRVIYEELVASPEAEIRKLVDYLGLPFAESCLHFYESERTVFTPSSEQVRRPISGEAVDHWRNFERWLGPVMASLGSAVDVYPSVPEDLR